MAKIITIDAGHGGSDSGAVNGRRHEADDVLKMAQAVGKLLTAQGIKVVYTRTSDKDITINERCEIANKAKSDYFLSIHRNSGGGVGFEIWVHSEASPATYAKAKGILDRVVAVIERVYKLEQHEAVVDEKIDVANHRIADLEGVKKE